MCEGYTCSNVDIVFRGFISIIVKLILLLFHHLTPRGECEPNRRLLETRVAYIESSVLPVREESIDLSTTESKNCSYYCI